MLAPVSLLRAHTIQLAADHRGIALPHTRHVLGYDEVRHLQVAELGGCVAEHPGERRVGLNNTAVQIGEPDADGGLGEDRAEPFLAGPQRVLRASSRLDLRSPDRLLLPQRAVAQSLHIGRGYCLPDRVEPVTDAEPRVHGTGSVRVRL